MDLLFCDVCNESVPQKDLDEGRAKRRRGRVVCATCEEAMSHSAGAGAQEGRGGRGDQPSVSPAKDDAKGGGAGKQHTASDSVARVRSGRESHTGGSGAALALAALGLAVAVGGTAYLNDRLESEVEARGAAVSEMRSALNSNSGRLEQGLQVELERLADEHARLQAEISSQREGIATNGRAERARTEALRADLSAMAERLTAQEALRAEIDRIELEVQKVGRFTADLHEQQLRLGQRIEDLRVDVGAVRELASVDLGALLGSPENPASNAEEERPAWLDFVGDLKSQSASVRWQAVQSIGQSGDTGAAGYLAPMLKDPDIFVRMAAARNLGDLAAPIGIPALIDALEDPEESVRESAAVSLRAVTGKDLRFQPDGKESDRAKAVKRWREWWSAAQAELLGNGQ